MIANTRFTKRPSMFQSFVQRVCTQPWLCQPKSIRNPEQNSLRVLSKVGPKFSTLNVEDLIDDRMHAILIKESPRAHRSKTAVSNAFEVSREGRQTDDQYR